MSSPRAAKLKELSYSNFERDKKLKKISFVDIKPTGIDLLNEKAHERIASSLSELIRNDHSFSKIIGLDGSWGAGKSNVIKIIEEHLRETHHVFIHDAWGHQEDLQRRSFLEELTDDLCSNGLLEKAKWGEKLKLLLSKTQETETKSVPRLSYGIIITLFVAVFTPLFNTIATTIESNIIKILVATAPLLTAGIIWIISSIAQRKILGLEDIFYLYKQKEITNITHVTISEKEPSVREFQFWIKDLSNDIKKKLIVVFDNMDRLPPSKVQQLWSSIHTFFSEDSYPNIWAIVPFDRTHIGDAFNQEPEKADHFINKTFSVIYRVSPPVLTDWHNFFKIKFEEAFHDTQNSEFGTIKNIFDILQENITPRSIISFINELVSLRRVAPEEVKTRYLALFILTQKKILKDPINQILNLAFLGSAKSLFQSDPDLPDSIASIVYNVPVKSASQVTLFREIELSLRNLNTERLNDLSKHVHFLYVLEQVINKEELNITNSILTLGSLPENIFEIDDEVSRINALWDILCAKRMESKLKEQALYQHDKILLSKCSQQNRLRLTKFIVEQIRNPEKFIGSKYYEVLHELRSYIKEQKLDIDLSKIITPILMTPSNFVDFLNSSKDSYEFYKAKTKEEDLNSYLIDQIPDGLSQCLGVLKAKNKYGFDIFLESIKEFVKENKVTEENFHNVYLYYKSLTKEKPIELLSDAKIHNLLTSSPKDSEDYYDLIAMRLARAEKFLNHGGLSSSVVNLDDETTIKEVAKKVEFYESYGPLLIKSISWTTPLLSGVLRDLTKNTYGESRLNITTALGNFKNILDATKIDGEDLIKKLDAWTYYAKKTINASNIVEKIPDYKFFENATRIDNDLSLYLVKSMADYLNSLSIQEWDKYLRDEDSYIFKVLHQLLAEEKLKPLPENLISAYKEILKSHARGEIELLSKNTWNLIYATCNKNKLKSTIKNIRDIFISETSITPEKFLFFSKVMEDHGDLKGRTNDVVRKILTPVASDEECLSYIIGNQDYYLILLERAKEDAYDFKDILRQKLSSSSLENLREFSQRLGVIEGEDELLDEAQ